MKYKIKLYDSFTDRNDWNDLVCENENRMFLFHRNFMDYHKDRFVDSSYLFYKQNKLVAILPACKIGSEFCSHAGLTYGGLLSVGNIGAKDVLFFFDLLLNELRNTGFQTMTYKPIPFIYCQTPRECDIYALFRYKFQISQSGLSSTCLLNMALKYTYEKKRSIALARSCRLETKETKDWEHFWNILEYNLSAKYNKKPVHSLSEIKLLASRFPNEIRLFASYDIQGQMLAGAVLFITANVVHLQYAASTTVGRKQGAMDLLIHYLLNVKWDGQRYFDYGISTESGGYYLNENLLHHKEGFGMSSVVYQTYELEL